MRVTTIKLRAPLRARRTRVFHDPNETVLRNNAVVQRVRLERDDWLRSNISIRDPIVRLVFRGCDSDIIRPVAPT